MRARRGQGSLVGLALAAGDTGTMTHVSYTRLRVVRAWCAHGNLVSLANAGERYQAHGSYTRLRVVRAMRGLGSLVGRALRERTVPCTRQSSTPFGSAGCVAWEPSKFSVLSGRTVPSTRKPSTPTGSAG